MSKDHLKKELHTMIDNIEDENFLNLVMEDIAAYQSRTKDVDDLSDLTEDEKNELKALIAEDPEKETLTENEFKLHIGKWRTRLSSKKGS